jgi:hypothetical protein
VGGSGGLWQIVLGWVPTLVWAGVVVTALVLFRTQLRALSLRLQKVSAAGVDVSFVADGLDAAAVQQQVPIDVGRRDGAVARAAAHPDLLRGAQVVWLDPRPANNRAERRTFRALGMDVVVETEVDAAIGLVERTDPDLVITNYGASAPGGPIAIQIGRRLGKLLPVIVYSTGTAGKPIPTGCFGQTDRPDDLLRLVIDAMESAHPYRQR